MTAEELTAEIIAVLEMIPGAVRVYEGGNPEENIAASLAISVLKLIRKVPKKEEFKVVGCVWTGSSGRQYAELTSSPGEINNIDYLIYKKE